MVKNARGVVFEYDGEWKIDDDLLIEINEYWKNYEKKNPSAFNEKIIVVEEINKNDNEEYKLKLKSTYFSTFLYSKLMGKIKTRSLFSGAYIKTKDNYMGMCLNNKYILCEDSTLNLIGGMTDYKDLISGEYKSENCLKREVKEELGFDLDNIKCKLHHKYLKYPSLEEDKEFAYPVGTIYEMEMDYTKDEIIEMFNNSKHDNEVKCLVFFTKDNYRDVYDYKCRQDYIAELIVKYFSE